MRSSSVTRARLAQCALSFLCGCNSILGIEELKPGTELDAGGPPADAQTGSSEVQPEAGRTAAGSGGAAPAAQGGAGGRTTTSMSGGAGAPAEAGKRAEPAAGSGGSAAGTSSSASRAGAGGGTAAMGEGPVQGRVIDYRRNPVPDVPVRIGDQMTKTDAEGRFRFDAVPDTYDVTLNIRTLVNGSANLRGAWQVQGLTRRDPTIQVYRGLPSASAEVHFQVSNVSFPLPSTRHLAVTWASGHGELQTELSGANLTTSASWVGASTSPGNAHALLYDVTGSPEVPSAYIAHDTHPIALQNGANDVPIAFDLTAQSIATDLVTGTLNGSGDNQVLHFFLRFSDDTAMRLPSLFPMGGSFSYLVPKLPGASLTLLYENSNNGRNQGQTAVHLDNVLPGQNGLSLSLPPIPTLTAPPPGKQNVDGSTEFSWSGTAKVYLLCAESVSFYENACVLTGKPSARLPVAPLSDYVPTAGEDFGWTVEVHGNYASVDEASGDAGFLSTAYHISSLPERPRGSGSYVTSATWGFTTAP